MIPDIVPRLEKIEGTISDLNTTILEVAARQGEKSECAGAGAMRDLLRPVTAKLDTVLLEVRDIGAPTTAPHPTRSLAAEMAPSSPAQTREKVISPSAKHASDS